MHRELIDALLSWVDGPLRGKTYRFLQGLALDELQFLAGFCGSCILESGGRGKALRAALAGRIAYAIAPFQPARQELKMVLLLEYLSRAGLSASAPARAGRAY